ncbi:universal stress protein [Curtobacterium flaccumfaciens]|nr:universal stress protein [Curtobacterium flaccumfaciens]
MAGAIATGPIVVGARLSQHESVIEVASSLAQRLGTNLVCVWVDEAQIPVGHRDDGSEILEYIDPDVAEENPPALDRELRLRISGIAARYDVSLRLEARAGNPDHTLATIAEEENASLIVVGTQDGGVRRAVHDFFNGSVAAHLAHRQHRPVVVVPIDPVGFDQPLPWEPA